jgi:electron transfer flavoprotein beta subunit
MRVCVSWRVVPSPEGTFFSASRGQVDVSGAERGISQADRSALELGLGLGEVTVVSAGSPEDERVLRLALALGASRLTRVSALLTEEQEHDPLVAARLLAGALREEGPDVLLFGAVSPDMGRGAVGPMTAACLGYPFTGGVLSVSAEGDGLRVEAASGRERVVFLASPPLALGVSHRAAEPRHPAPVRVMQAMRAPVKVISREVPGTPLRVKGYGSLKSKARLLEALPPGTPEETARSLWALLRQRQVL